MSYEMYCPKCKKNVQVKEVWDSKTLMTLILLLIPGLLPGIVYILIKTFSGDECPECGASINMMKPPIERDEKPENLKFCIFCDAPIERSLEICPKCGNRVRRRLFYYYNSHKYY